MPPLSNYQHIYAVVARIPRGRVATYGQIAELAGIPGHARQVGYALHRTPDDVVVPWHRVINAQGRISLGEHAGAIQRQLLASEGVELRGDRVDLKRYRWLPRRR